ncbi:hypothetical protein I316_06366 [Kwoniella heveanensis BCC8398]|uniref:Uncharacterized protein n=1 Tax=Kwoniella heveanensis BCC8398 TaxID=1296120 RepID=A0A1B9GLN0_9TREE|nr:hypothetical protein I316_06366 [Kwoniella heveanensis BCC8398]
MSQPRSDISIDPLTDLNISIRSSDNANHNTPSGPTEASGDAVFTQLSSEGGTPSASPSRSEAERPPKRYPFDDAMSEETKALGVTRAEPETFMVSMPTVSSHWYEKDPRKRIHTRKYLVKRMDTTPNPVSLSDAPEHDAGGSPSNPDSALASCELYMHRGRGAGTCCPSANKVSTTTSLNPAQRVFSQWTAADPSGPHVKLRQGVVFYPSSKAYSVPDDGSIKEPEFEGYQNTQLYVGIDAYTNPNNNPVWRPSKVYLSEIGTLVTKDRLDHDAPPDQQDHSYRVQQIKLDEDTKTKFQQQLDLLRERDFTAGAHHFPLVDPTIFTGDGGEGSAKGKVQRTVISWNDQLECIAGLKDGDQYFGVSTTPEYGQRFPGPFNPSVENCYDSAIVAWKVLETDNGTGSPGHDE